MPSLRRTVPSMSALATFEAAARLTSFTAAAAELGVTQAAVSRQIKLLEDDLNTRLFVRANRRVTLTTAGLALASTVGTAFKSMAEMIETIRQPATENTVNVGASIAFCHLWVLPRLSDFRSRHPEVRLKLVADDNPPDLRRDKLDVAFRFGKPPFVDSHSLASASDEVFPVCSPALLHRFSMTPQDATLAKLPLIASDTVNPSWLTWRTWAQGVGRGPEIGIASDRSGLRFNHYTDTIQAAVNGEGVALGWRMLLKGHLDEGRLLRVGADCLTLEEGYHLLLPTGRQPSDATGKFIDWIVELFDDPPSKTPSLTLETSR